MRAFDHLDGIALPLFEDNIDTDQLCPKQHLKRLDRAGFGDALFSDRRFNVDGSADPTFILNQTPWSRPAIIVAGDNFACGSSREHAVWALVDFGIRCVIAPSFGDIFFQNSVNSGLLAIQLPRQQVATLAALAMTEAGKPWRIDLPAQRIIAPSHSTIAFAIEPERKQRLLAGLDEIGITLQQRPAIADFEDRQKTTEPWLWQANGN